MVGPNALDPLSLVPTRKVVSLPSLKHVHSGLQHLRRPIDCKPAGCVQIVYRPQ